MWRAPLLSCLAGPALACDLALALAVDVSGSVDASEYATQMQGLALALRDPVVSETLVRARAQVTLVQWTGSSRQATTLPWTPIASHADVEAFAARVAADPRVWRNFSTAIGEALAHTARAFEDVPQCRRRVIDVSGDGRSNEGQSPRATHAALRAQGITVNALVIESDASDLTGYFWENVITGDGAFVVTAQGFDQYPEKIRQKLLRETTRQVSRLEE
ncbi:DUF1194 domain-containing protein [Pseudaestuariivita atlantica]|uniref:von Willebrand factor A n=1 Tax=Pseudaestuariivita atlantica TaxID=1317121 RepID=A0A0L1JSK9_9RHOB|nr:DUF1194 domain-containing protein [Pseudaestuariivita atlantica]KNG94378.1 von Willebrand factor A [Pseudaestuariivita atlantica]